MMGILKNLGDIRDELHLSYMYLPQPPRGPDPSIQTLLLTNGSFNTFI